MLCLVSIIILTGIIASTIDAFATSCALLVIAPELQTGSSLFTEITAGQQVVITTAFSNNCGEQDQPYVGIIEVRNSDGVTEYLAWRTGTLQYGDTVDMGASWTPEHGDTYELRTFIITDLQKPEILSRLAISNVTIAELAR
jgi:hypothetical protein